MLQVGQLMLLKYEVVFTGLERSTIEPKLEYQRELIDAKRPCYMLLSSTDKSSHVFIHV